MENREYNHDSGAGSTDYLGAGGGLSGDFGVITQSQRGWYWRYWRPITDFYQRKNGGKNLKSGDLGVGDGIYHPNYCTERRLVKSLNAKRSVLFSRTRSLGESFAVFLFSDCRQSVDTELKTHPLPANLAQWQEQNQPGDYFDAVEISPVGALIWSQFPVKIYLQSDRSSWLSLVQQAIAEWGQYLPMELVNRAELADILIKRSYRRRESVLMPKLVIRTAPGAFCHNTIRDFCQGKSLTHRMSIQISPNLADRSALAAARHD